jgi:5-oxoprolinase (ATP-hydrolysing)
MAEAIRRISVRRGYDPAGYVLVAFGGAGAQHACAVAGLLGILTVLVPRDAGLLSALGLGAAVIERFAHRQVLMPLAECGGRLAGWLDELGGEARRAVVAEGVPEREAAVRRRLAELRFTGQESALEVEIGAGGDVRHDLAAAAGDAFAERYRERYGYLPEGREIELVALRLAASSADATLEPAAEEPRAPAAASSTAGRRRAWFDGWRETPVYDRDALRTGARVAGPALVFEAHSATVLPPGWSLTVDRVGALRLEAER